MLILVIICLVGALGLAYWSEKRSVSAPSGPAKVTVTVRDDVGKPVYLLEIPSVSEWQNDSNCLRFYGQAGECTEIHFPNFQGFIVIEKVRKESPKKE